MKLVKTLLASAALVASVGAQAVVVGSLGGGAGSFLALSAPGACGSCTLGTTVATISGGRIYDTDMPVADQFSAGERFLAAGPSSNGTSTLTFGGGGVDYISFLWGSPDLYNTLTVTSTGAAPTSQMFTATSLGFPVTNGQQGFAQSVQFSGVAGAKITSLVFASTADAFEVGRFTVTAIPEPETYALMLAGLGALGFVARRRKKA